MSKINIELELVPFIVPTTVQEVPRVPGPRAFIPGSAVPPPVSYAPVRTFLITELSAEELSSMCNEFREGLFKAARKEDPHNATKLLVIDEIDIMNALKESDPMFLHEVGEYLEKVQALASKLNAAGDPGYIGEVQFEGAAEKLKVTAQDFIDLPKEDLTFMDLDLLLSWVDVLGMHVSKKEAVSAAALRSRMREAWDKMNGPQAACISETV